MSGKDYSDGLEKPGKIREFHFANSVSTLSWFSVSTRFLKPVIVLANFMLMSCAKNYSHWAAVARDIAINLRGPVFLRHSVYMYIRTYIYRNNPMVHYIVFS